MHRPFKTAGAPRLCRMRRHTITVTRTITRSSSPPATPHPRGANSVLDVPANKKQNLIPVMVLWALCCLTLTTVTLLTPSPLSPPIPLTTVTTLLTPSTLSPPPHSPLSPPSSLTTVATLELFLLTVSPTEPTQTATVVTNQQVLEIVKETML